MPTQLIGWTADEYRKWAKEYEERARTTDRRVVSPEEFRIEYERDKPKVNGESPAKISGYASVFSEFYELWPGFREAVAPGAFAKTIKEDDVRALWNHEASAPLARNNGSLILREDSKGLYYEFVVPDTTAGRDLLTNIKLRIVTQSSFGFNIVEQSLKYDREKDLVSRTLTEVKLFDVSPVTFPASPSTEVNVRSLGLISADREIVELRDTPLIEAPPQLSDEDLFKQIEALRK